MQPRAVAGGGSSGRIPAGLGRVAAIASLCLVLAGCLAGVASGQTLRAQIRLTGQSNSIPRSFFGLSLEVNELPTYVQEGAVFDRALSLLRPASGDDLMLRVGGKSADDAYWKSPVLNAPPWVFEIGDQWLGQLAALVARDRLRVTLDLNLATHSPLMAAGFARAASKALAPRGLAGLAVGNEPDLFGHQPGLDRERVDSTLRSTPLDWTRDYSPLSYRRDYVAYARALARAVPGIPLAGPESARSSPRWLGVFRGLGPLMPKSLSIHRYASSTCWAKDSPRYPRISLLLSERSTAGLAERLRRAIAYAHQAGMSFLVSELNSVSCGGNEGVADSFATALWAPDVLFELLREGVDGVNWHIRPRLLNAPFELLAGAIEPLPEFYGLALFAQMIGPEASRLGVHVSSAGGLHLKAWATRSRAQTNVLLINKGTRSASVALSSASPGGRALVQRLLAPSTSARDNVTLAGRAIGSDGRWHGRKVVASVPLRGGSYHVLVPGYSAALVQVARL
jgi:hypothetical protein